MSERIIPDGNTDAHPISGLDEFHTHLRDLENDPSVPFNLKLLDDIELQLTGKSTLYTHITPSYPVLSRLLINIQNQTSLLSSQPSSRL